MLRSLHRLRLPVTTAAMALLMGATAFMAPALADDDGASMTNPGDGRHPRAEVRHEKFFPKFATFNILGSQHTDGRRRYVDLPGLPSWRRGVVRAGYTAQLIKDRDVDVIGMQEVQLDQLRVLSRRLPEYAIWPGTRLGNQGMRLQIAYRTSEYTLVAADKIYTRFDRQVRPIPFVRLRHRASGQEFYFVTVHNSPKSMERERDVATAAEVRLVRRLKREGLPVFISGDTNEFIEFVCKMGRGAGMVSASGDRVRPRCHTARRRPVIDKIMGSRGVEFKRYRQTRYGLVARASDHYFVTVRVRVPQYGWAR